MSTRQHVLASGRRTDCPVWAVNTALTAQVVVRFMEQRAGMRHVSAGTIRERIERAERRIMEKLPTKREQLAQTLKRHMEAHGEAREKLAVLCENLDTQIIIAQMGARLVTGVVSYYYLQGWDSVETGQALGIKPPHVRQISYRLNRCWREVCGERVPAKRTIVEKPCEKCHRQFKPTRGSGRQRFCSIECRAAAQLLAKSYRAPFECAYCQKLVVHEAGHVMRRKYCSKRCGSLAYASLHGGGR